MSGFWVHFLGIAHLSPSKLASTVRHPQADFSCYFDCAQDKFHENNITYVISRFIKVVISYYILFLAGKKDFLRIEYRRLWHL